MGNDAVFLTDQSGQYVLDIQLIVPGIIGNSAGGFQGFTAFNGITVLHRFSSSGYKIGTEGCCRQTHQPDMRKTRYQYLSLLIMIES